jgi:DNA-directed RNA polymerase subunit F
MDSQNIKILRNKISVPLNVAKKLLSENNNDIELSVQKFHKNNINTICRLAECDDTIAEKYYLVCKYDIEKTIKKIHEQLFYLTATPNQPIDKIGFIIWAENDSLNDYATSRDKSLFIQTKDFEYIMDIIREYRKEFDTTGFNKFDNQTMRKIVEQIARIATNDSEVESFLRALIKWFNSKLRYAHNIIIYGNL